MNGSGPPRANAAQLASRNIRSVRAPKRTQNNKPLQGSPSPQFAPVQPPIGQAGMLFGGSVQAPSTFSFTTNGPEFPAFGGPTPNNPFATNGGMSQAHSDNDERRDPAEERASKRQSRDGGFQQGGSIFQTPNIFGQNQQSNGFGPSNGQQSSNGFSFGTSQSQTPSVIDPQPLAPAEKPQASPFSFGSTSQSNASGSQTSFGSTAQEKQGSNMFGFGSQSAAPIQNTASPLFNFGSSAPTPKHATTPFAFGQTSTQQSNEVSSQLSSNGFNFGSTPVSSTSASNIFGTSQASSANMFGSSSQAQPITTNPFASLNPPGPSTNNVFGSRESSPAAPSTTTALNLFGTVEQNPKPASTGLFGTPAQVSTSSTGNPFAHSNQKSNSPALFGEQESQPTNNIFGKTVAASASPFSTPNEDPPKASIFGGQNQQRSSAPDLVGNLNKPVNQTVPQQQFLSTPKSDSNNAPVAAQPSIFDQSFKSPLRKSNTPSTLQASQEVPTDPSASKFSFEAAQSSVSAANDPPTSVRSVDDMEAPITASNPAPSGMFPSLQSPRAPQESNGKRSDLSQTATPSAPSREVIARLIQGENVTRNYSDNGSSLLDIGVARKISDEFIKQYVPESFSEDQRKDFYTTFRLRILNKSMQHFFESLSVLAEPGAAIKFYLEQRNLILDDLRVRRINKRGVEELGQSETALNQRPNQTDPVEVAPSKARVSRSASPPKQSNNDTQPRLNGHSLAETPVIEAPKLSTASTDSPSRGKRKAEEQLVKGDDEKGERRIRAMKSPNLSASSGGSNTSNIFKNIVDSPSKSRREPSPTKTTVTVASPVTGTAPRQNPFGALPMPTSPNKVTERESLSTHLESSKSASPISITTSSQAGDNLPKSIGLKLPTFTASPANFLSQFGKSAEQAEKEKMEAAKAEDMDSDEDEAEWEKSYQEKRRAQLRELKDQSKQKSGGFVFKPASNIAIVKPTEKSAAQPLVPSTAFGLNPPSQNQGNGLSSPQSLSRTSTPGPISSAPGSILNGHTGGKLGVNNNIFGYLSNSDLDTGKSDDADDESGDDTDADVDADSENKDPNYKPEDDNASGPGTPVEETGAGIASAKKSTPFMFGGTSRSGGGLFSATNSGSSTPGGSGSIFDRINKDSNGDPIRHVSTEEKENTQPSSANIFKDTKNPFSSRTKSSETPMDQTWKPDSPIKFGAATKDPPPTVNVTAATPTKSGSPGLFASLNNSNGPTSAPFSNLFGNSTNSKPAASTGVGFNFGGASSTSSLFPSATTSRATTPGATTDGDSAAEADADAEKHEQIDLTAGGPGEEDEDIVHEVRVKATKYIPKTSQWETRGVGPLRVLKHKDSASVRLLIRADPRGTIVLNKGILRGDYKADGKTVKIIVAGESEEPLQTWLLQVKTPEFARDLAKVLEANKPS